MSLLFRPDLLAVEVAGDTTVIKLLSARCADHNAEPISQQCADLVDRLGRHKLHIDLGQVEFLSGVVLAKLVALDQKVRAVGGELRLCNVRPTVYQVFAATHLTRLLDIRPHEPGQETLLGAFA
jgi:anti-sigma B factor antagonist